MLHYGARDESTMDTETKLTSSEEYVKNKRIKKMTLIDRIKYEITDFVKDIRFYLDLEKARS